MNRLATEWALWMLPALWQVSLLAAAVLVLDLALRRVAWPQLLHALWLLVPLGLLLPSTRSSLAAGPTVAAPATPPVAWLAFWAGGVLLFGTLALLAHAPRRSRSAAMTCRAMLPVAVASSLASLTSD